MNGTIVAVQMVSGPDLTANLAEARRLIGQAAAAGAGLVVLPENFALMGMNEADKLACREHEEGGPIQETLSSLAAEHGLWIVGGTIPLASADPARAYAACLLYDDHGKRVARYDKIHLFDVTLEHNGERYLESRTTVPGDRVVVVDTPFGRLGLAVCYDLRFPEVFRSMLDQDEADRGAVRVHRVHRQGALGDPGASAGDREPVLRDRRGAGWCARQWSRNLRRQHDRRPLGRGARRARGAGLVAAEYDHDHLVRIRRNFPAVSHRRVGAASAG